jgi:hypothetical protein
LGNRKGKRLPLINADEKTKTSDGSRPDLKQLLRSFMEQGCPRFSMSFFRSYRRGLFHAFTMRPFCLNYGMRIAGKREIGIWDGSVKIVTAVIIATGLPESPKLPRTKTFNHRGHEGTRRRSGQSERQKLAADKR